MTQQASVWGPAPHYSLLQVMQPSHQAPSIHSFNKYILSTYHAPGIILALGKLTLTQAAKVYTSKENDLK